VKKTSVYTFAREEQLFSNVEAANRVWYIQNLLCFNHHVKNRNYSTIHQWRQVADSTRASLFRRSLSCPAPRSPPSKTVVIAVLIPSLFLWTSAAETNSLHHLTTRLSALPPPAVAPLRSSVTQKPILTYRALRPPNVNSESVQQNNVLHHVTLPAHQTDPNSEFWILDDQHTLSVMEAAGPFHDILTKMDSGWQERLGNSLTLEGRGIEWGRDWHIWYANLKQGNRFRGVVVEVLPHTRVRG